jgi:hypothetical protein
MNPQADFLGTLFSAKKSAARRGERRWGPRLGNRILSSGGRRNARESIPIKGQKNPAQSLLCGKKFSSFQFPVSNFILFD